MILSKKSLTPEQKGRPKMKRIGLLAGMTFESSVDYYYQINRKVNAALGGKNCAEMIVYNVNFEPIYNNMAIENWEPIYKELIRCAKILERDGAECLVIATNTMHRFASRMQEELRIPILHIADAVAGAARKRGVTKAALLGTKFTMTQDFLKDRLLEDGVSVEIPLSESEIEEIHRIIIDELSYNDIRESSRKYYCGVVERLVKERGAQGVILGCTEIGLLIKDQDLPIPVLDTTQEHINAAVQFIVSG